MLRWACANSVSWKSLFTSDFLQVRPTCRFPALTRSTLHFSRPPSWNFFGTAASGTSVRCLRCTRPVTYSLSLTKTPYSEMRVMSPATICPGASSETETRQSFLRSSGRRVTTRQKSRKLWARTRHGSLAPLSAPSPASLSDSLLLGQKQAKEAAPFLGAAASAFSGVQRMRRPYFCSESIVSPCSRSPTSTAVSASGLCAQSSRCGSRVR
mmetsp:Transcript_8857/g.26189  ORF Transcript_8857/g.26189 Transcript_8857/m.26189 type:complete len:211 (-) Transcript_8857:1044-1676(-)